MDWRSAGLLQGENPGYESHQSLHSSTELSQAFRVKYLFNGYQLLQGLPSPVMARVFISHSSRDNVSAKSRKDWLEKKNFEVPFLDIDKHAGILLSANWIDSKWCFAEFTLARALGKEVFQVIESDSTWPWPSADGNPGPIPAANLQCLDLCVRSERRGWSSWKRS